MNTSPLNSLLDSLRRCSDGLLRAALNVGAPPGYAHLLELLLTHATVLVQLIGQIERLGQTQDSSEPRWERVSELARQADSLREGALAVSDTRDALELVGRADNFIAVLTNFIYSTLVPPVLYDAPFSVENRRGISRDQPRTEIAYNPSLSVAISRAPAVARPRKRYANVTLLDGPTGRRLSARAPIAPGQAVRLRVGIGRLSADSHVKLPKEFPDDRVPGDVDLDVMVSSTEFALADANVEVRDHQIVHGRLFLPRDGGSARAPDGSRHLNFHLRAPERVGPAHARIGYYYRSVLVQSQQIIVDVGESGGVRVITDYTVSSDLTELDVLPTRRRVSILTNLNQAGSHQVVLRAPGADGEVSAKTFEVSDAKLGPVIRRLRAALTERAPSTIRRRREELEEDLRRIARPGWDLYSIVAAQALDVVDALRESSEEYVLQVSRPTTSSFVVPWSLMYEIPLLSERPAVCPMVAQWEEGTPLIRAGITACPYGPHVENVLCPFGFLGFRYAIEQLSSGESPVLTINAAPDCSVVVAQTQVGVNLKDLEAHVRDLRDVFREAFPQAALNEAKDLNTLRSLLGSDLPIVYFYCHGDRRYTADPNTWLAIGRNEILTAQAFVGWIVAWRRQDKRVWDQVRPLVFINACHSLEICPETLVSYLDAFVGTARAAGVIGTEVKVHQELAAHVAERFFTLFVNAGHTAESALRAVRLEYLAAGNLIGLAYTPYCWADLRIVLGTK
jgi:CHAT domain